LREVKFLAGVISLAEVATHSLCGAGRHPLAVFDVAVAGEPLSSGGDDHVVLLTNRCAWESKMPLAQPADAAMCPTTIPVEKWVHRSAGGFAKGQIQLAKAEDMLREHDYSPKFLIAI
jgi:hypothetical protein